jgi:hypothetical protein
MNKNDWNNFVNLFPMIAECYGDRFAINDAKINLWWQLLSEYEFNHIYSSVIKHMKESTFEPKPADIIKLMQPDFDDAFNRMINKQPHRNHIEKLVSASVGYACRTQLSDIKARELYKKEYKRLMEQSNQPYTPSSHQISQKVEQRPTDKMVDENIDRFKGKSKEEIQAMLNRFKSQVKR